MIVHANDRGGTFPDGGAEDFPGMGEGGGCGTRGYFDHLAEPIPSVEAEDPELLDVEPGHDGCEVGGDEVAPVECRGFSRRLSHRSPGDFHDGNQLASLAMADAFEPLKIGCLPGGQSGNGSSFAYDP